MEIKETTEKSGAGQFYESDEETIESELARTGWTIHNTPQEDDLEAKLQERMNICICGTTIGRTRAYCSDRCRNVTKHDILFYCGLNEKHWNHHAVEPGERVCIAPVTLAGKAALRRTQVL